MKRALHQLLIVLFCSVPAVYGAESVLARVNGESVTGAQLKAVFKRKHGGHEKFLGGEREVRDFLKIVIDERLLLQEAYRLDLDKEPATVNAVKEEEKRRLSAEFTRTEIEAKSVPAEGEIRRVWEQQLAEVVQVREIVLDDETEAQWAYRTLLGGAEFGDLARNCSIAPSWLKGGEIAPVGWGGRDPAWERLVFRLEPGELSEPFLSADGWTVVQMEGRRPAIGHPFEKVRGQIEAILRKRKMDTRREEVSSFLWTKYHAKLAIDDLGPEGFRRALDGDRNAPAATWNGGSLTVGEFASTLDTASIGRLTAGRLRQRLTDDLRSIVDSRLAVIEARSRRWSNLPSVAEALRSVREDRMENALFSEHVLRGIEVSDEEIRAYFGSHEREFTEPEKWNIAQIVLRKREDAESVRSRILGGENFAALAKKLSTDTGSSGDGGDLGWVTRKEISGPFQPILNLKQGELSQPIESQFGFHIFKVAQIAPERPVPFDEARERARKAVLVKKWQEKRLYWLGKLREVAEIKLNEIAIREFVKENAFPIQ
jgi:parvulin-like peptidyl-prolyl isomerase